MALYLRDEQLSFLTIDRDAITQLVLAFESCCLSMPEFREPTEEQPDANVFRFFTIRFDEKGYKLDSLDQLLQIFDSATEVERLIFEAHSGESLQSNQRVGSYVGLNLDTNELVNSFITVSSDDEGWMNGTFASIKDILNRRRNKCFLMRNAWAEALARIVVVVVGFAVSIWAALKVSQASPIENAFLISFLLFFFVFSNLWTPISAGLGQRAKKLFPRIRLYRPQQDGLHWLYQALVAAAAAAAFLAIILAVVNWIVNVLSGLVGVDV